MKTLAIWLNLILILNVVYLFNQGIPSEKPASYDIGLFLLFLGTPIINLLYLFFWRGESGSWIALYFKRKALEEKKKIEKLLSKEGEGQ